MKIILEYNYVFPLRQILYFSVCCLGVVQSSDISIEYMGSIRTALKGRVENGIIFRLFRSKSRPYVIHALSNNRISASKESFRIYCDFLFDTLYKIKT